jgi:hypothetical protein
VGSVFQLIHACLPTTVGSSAAHRRKRQRSLRVRPTMFDKLKRIDWMAKLRKAFFLLPLQLAPKHHFKAARPGGHFLSERPEK